MKLQCVSASAAHARDAKFFCKANKTGFRSHTTMQGRRHGPQASPQREEARPSESTGKKTERQNSGRGSVPHSRARVPRKAAIDQSDWRGGDSNSAPAAAPATGAPLPATSCASASISATAAAKQGGGEQPHHPSHRCPGCERLTPSPRASLQRKGHKNHHGPGQRPRLRLK